MVMFSITGVVRLSPENVMFKPSYSTGVEFEFVQSYPNRHWLPSYSFKSMSPVAFNETETPFVPFETFTIVCHSFLARLNVFVPCDWLQEKTISSVWYCPQPHAPGQISTMSVTTSIVSRWMSCCRKDSLVALVPQASWLEAVP